MVALQEIFVHYQTYTMFVRFAVNVTCLPEPLGISVPCPSCLPHVLVAPAEMPSAIAASKRCQHHLRAGAFVTAFDVQSLAQQLFPSPLHPISSWNQLLVNALYARITELLHNALPEDVN